jgi:hypothetical protein
VVALMGGLVVLLRRWALVPVSAPPR